MGNGGDGDSADDAGDVVGRPSRGVCRRAGTKEAAEKSSAARDPAWRTWRGAALANTGEGLVSEWVMSECATPGGRWLWGSMHAAVPADISRWGAAITVPYRRARLRHDSATPGLGRDRPGDLADRRLYIRRAANRGHSPYVCGLMAGVCYCVQRAR